jgi:hypothetical protein
MALTSTLLDTEQAAKLLRVKSHTLEVWRCNKRYPLKFVSIGSKIFYRDQDIEEFIQSRVQSGTSETLPRGRRRRQRNQAGK